MYSRILVPLDGSNLAETVLPVATEMAGYYNATLVLLNILEKDGSGTIHGQRHLSTTGEACDYLESLAVKLRSQGFKVETEAHEARESDVARSISEHARELKTDLIILCAHGNGGIRDVLIGGMAQQVIQRETIPVLFIRPEKMGSVPHTSWKTILVPLDGAPMHETVLPHAVAVAQRSGAVLRLLTVVPTADTLRVKEDAVRRVLPGSMGVALDYSVEESQQYLQKICTDLSRQKLLASGVVTRGDATTRILETITKEHIDLVIMATYGHRNWDAFWEESVTPKVLANSPVPVLFVRETRE
ncbi:MAG TPA: universal stress protein [Longilinea sp.]|nr:universal stress protein [Longilinea sp.]